MATPTYNYAAIAKVADPNVVSSIIRIGRARGLSDDHIATALAVGIVESNLRNLSGGDRDSKGVFQQRPSQGWGSVSQVTNVDYATNKFYDTLVRTPRKSTLGLWGQAVQRSSHPDRYDAALGAARQFMSGTVAPALPKIAEGVGKAAQGLQSKGGPGPGGQVPLGALRPSEARARVTEILQAISTMRKERAGSGKKGDPTLPGAGPLGTTPTGGEQTRADALSATVRGPAEAGDQVNTTLEGDDPDDWERTVSEVRALHPAEDVDSDANLAVAGLLAPNARDIADAEEAEILAEAQEAQRTAQAAQDGTAAQQGQAKAAAGKATASAPAGRPAGPATGPSFADWKKGKSNGQIPLNQLTNLGGGHYLAPHVATSFERMRADAAREGVNLTLTDSYRTLASQQALVAKKGLYSQGGLAAAPGTSGHGWGYDIDIGGGAQRDWMARNGARYGWKTIPREPWHWQMR